MEPALNLKMACVSRPQLLVTNMLASTSLTFSATELYRHDYLLLCWFCFILLYSAFFLLLRQNLTVAQASLKLNPPASAS